MPSYGKLFSEMILIMKKLLKELWQQDRKTCLRIIILQIISSLMGGVGIVMLIPMLELLDISVGTTGWLANILVPLNRVSVTMRALSMVGIYIGLIVLKGILNRTLTIQQTKFIEGYTLSLRDRLYEAVSHASWQQLSSRKQADTINLFTNQCSQVSTAVSSMITLLASMASAVIQLIIACWMSLPITLVVCLAGFILITIFIPLRKKSREYGNEMIRIGREFYSELFNQLNSVKEIRTYGVEDAHTELYKKLSSSFMETQVKYAKIRTKPNLVYSIVAAVLISLIYVVFVLFLDMETAKLMVLVLIFARLWPMFTSWQGIIQNIQTCVPALEKVNEAICMMKASAGEQYGIEGITVNGNVIFDHVTFQYQESEKTILDNVSFSLEQGKITALVGRSGAGKSTIADMLMGFLHPKSGQICIDGVELTDDNIRSWRKFIGYIPQNPLIINASIRENLKRFHPEATEEEIVSALKQAAAWHFVKNLPQGLDTVLGDQGVRLSGGERQRIVMARVLLGKPRFIILDEATSNLDFESENAIQDVLKELRGQVTVLVIAHRFATIRTADHVIVLQDGHVVEEGTVRQLMQKKDSYLVKMIDIE